MSKAVIYTRFSPRRNADSSESCETQESLCRDYADKAGYPVKSVHEDRGISGKSSDRPGLAKALANLRKGDVLLVYKRDRLARDVLIAELTRRQVASAGATIEAVSGDIAGDDSDPTVMFVRQIMDAVAELERKQIAIRTSDAMRVHQKAGRLMSRFAPYGFSIDPDDKTMIRPLQSEQEGIELIREMHGDGLNPHVITDKMNEDWPEMARAKKWNRKLVMKIIERL